MPRIQESDLIEIRNEQEESESQSDVVQQS